MKVAEEKNEEKYKRLFTKEEKKNIISEKYNLLNEDSMSYEREGLFMEKTKEVRLKEGKNIDTIVLKCCCNICEYYNVKSDLINSWLSEN